MSYSYIKAPPGYTLEKPISFGKRLRYGISLVFITLGVAVFTTVAYPLISYEYSYSPKFKQVKAAQEPMFVEEVVNTSLDYTNASTWFAGSGKSKEQSDYALYTLSIKKLGIDNAVVRSDHTDLKQSLIQYAGTALPGNLGNTVIFGHSVLPQFFNPKNYLTIFSTLHTLKIGDTIDISADGASYTYKISDMYETAPDDLSPLAQTYNGRYLTMITCTPPGTYLRRLIIKASVI